MTRRESREVAFELLFDWSFTAGALDEIIENAKVARAVKVDDFAVQLAGKAIEACPRLDELIEQYSQARKLQRISRTTLTVLRLSFCEMTMFGDIPVGATINEAVELAKKYGSDEEGAFLNGILGTFERVRKGQQPEPPKPIRVNIEDNVSIAQNIQTEQEIHNEQPHNTDDVQVLEDIVIEVE